MLLYSSSALHRWAGDRSHAQLSLNQTFLEATGGRMSGVASIRSLRSCPSLAENEHIGPAPDEGDGLVVGWVDYQQ